MALWAEGREVERQKHVTPRSCEGKQHRAQTWAFRDLEWQAHMDTGAFGSLGEGMALKADGAWGLGWRVR